MKYFRKASLAWARFQFRISKPWRLVGLLVAGLVVLVNGVMRYLKTESPVDSLVALAGLLLASLVFERAGFIFWIEDLQAKTPKNPAEEKHG